MWFPFTFNCLLCAYLIEGEIIIAQISRSFKYICLDSEILQCNCFQVLECHFVTSKKSDKSISGMLNQLDFKFRSD